MPWKGLEDLIVAIKSLRRQDVRLVIVGGNRNDPYVSRLIEQGGDFLLHGPLQPHSSMPALLAIADFVVLPQRRHLIAATQTTAKVFEAMAMARPIIATSLQYLTEILDDVGRLVKPERPDELAAALDWCLSNPDEAEEMGRAARRRCQSQYSYDAMGGILSNVLGGHHKIEPAIG